jgi:hypothetical protein
VEEKRGTRRREILTSYIVMTTVLATVSLGATPTLFGSEVTVVGYYPTLQDPFTFPAMATVGPSVEFPAGSIVSTGQVPIVSLNVDIGASSIDVQYLLNQQAAVGTFNGLVFTFDSSSPVITGVSLDPSSTITRPTETLHPAASAGTAQSHARLCP